MVVLLILSGALIEILLSELDQVYGFIFAASSLLLVRVDARLIFLTLALIALHFCYITTKNALNLQLTEEARERRGFVEMRQFMHESRLQRNIHIL